MARAVSRSPGHTCRVNRTPYEINADGAMAEWLHRRVREEWGFGDGKELSPEDLIRDARAGFDALGLSGLVGRKPGSKEELHWVPLVWLIALFLWHLAQVVCPALLVIFIDVFVDFSIQWRCEQ